MRDAQAVIAFFFHQLDTRTDGTAAVEHPPESRAWMAAVRPLLVDLAERDPDGFADRVVAAYARHAEEGE